MVELHVVGDALISVEGVEVRPSSPMLFASLLYLGSEAGRRVRRAELQELLFPDGDHGKSSHSLRQLLYKLKRAGVPLRIDGQSVTLPGPEARIVLTGRADLGVLPNYSGNVSGRFAEWVEGFRSHVSLGLRASLLGELAAARSDGDATAIITAADRLLAIDPLNEEAVLARAEALAILGQKAAALRLLDDYRKELAQSSQLTLSTEVLRKRIADRVAPRGVVPLLGRAHELAELLSLARGAKEGRPALAAIWGEAGIGKTRLVQELETHLLLQPGSVWVTRCRPHDAARPMGPCLDILPRLLRARGASGASPESHAVAQAVLANRAGPSSSPEFGAARLRAALEDLFASVSSEAPIALIVEDAQWLDAPSEEFLCGLSRLPSALLVILTYRAESLPSAVLAHASHVRKLGPLAPDSARSLLSLTIGGEVSVADGLLERCVSLAAGNALFLCTIAEHFRRNGAALSSEATLHELLRQRVAALGPIALLVLRTTIALGVHGTYDRLERSLSLAHGTLLLALQELTELGMVVHTQEGIECAHDLLGDVVRAGTAQGIQIGVLSRVAEILEEDGQALQHPGLLWSCAEAWTGACNRRRAGAALRQCAHIAINISQSRFAIGALEKAQSYLPPGELGACLEDTIRIANDCWDSDAVDRNVAQLRSWRVANGLDPQGSTMAEIAILNSLRRAERPIWDKRDRIRQCALSADASFEDRLSAARVFMQAAEEQLDRSAADDLHDQILRLGGEARDSNPWLHYQLTYHGAFGDLSLAAEVARRVLGRRSTSTEPVLSAINQAAFVLFRSGDVEQACALYEEVLTLAQRSAANPATEIHFAAFLAFMCIQIGDYEQAEHFNALSVTSLNRSGREHTGGILSNSIELALEREDFTLALSLQEQLRSNYSSLFTPNRERVALANDLLLLAASGKCAPDALVAKAEHLFRRGATFSESDKLAHGLAVTYSHRGERQATHDLLGTYFAIQRRDRHPVPPKFAYFAKQVGIDPRASVPKQVGPSYVNLG